MNEDHGAPPVLRVSSGRPTDEEVAALVAALLACTGGAPADEPTARPRWGAPATGLASSYGPRRGGWKASGLPR